MARKKFYFNPETIKYEEIRITFSYRLKRLLYHLLSGILLGVAFFFIFVSIIKSPKEKEMAIEGSRIEGQFKALQGQMKEIRGVLSDLQQRDNNLYRVILQADPIPLDSRNSTASNAKYYDQLLNMTNSQIVVETTRKLNQIKKQLYVQSKSYDELIVIVQNKEELMRCMPSIQPVSNKDLTRVASGWGMRVDPIYHTLRFHQGMDFTAPEGTDVYATGNGKIKSVGWEQSFGNCIRIDHGFGYETLYAHLSEIYSYQGQSVVRGEVIGLVGSTGKSTGPHLHYEVHKKGVPVNPQNYYFMDLTPEEYDRMIQLSNSSGRMMD